MMDRWQESRIRLWLTYAVTFLVAGLVFWWSMPSEEMLAAVESNRLTTIMVSKERGIEITIVHPRGREENAKSREGAVPLLRGLEVVGLTMVDASQYQGIIPGVAPREMSKCTVWTNAPTVRVECFREDNGQCFMEKEVGRHAEALSVVRRFMACVRERPMREAPMRPPTLKPSQLRSA